MTRACTLLIRRETDVLLPRKASDSFIQGRTGHAHHNKTCLPHTRVIRPATRWEATRGGTPITVQV